MAIDPVTPILWAVGQAVSFVRGRKIKAEQTAIREEAQRLDAQRQHDIAMLRQRDEKKAREIERLRRQQQRSAEEFRFVRTVAAVAGVLVLVMASFIVGVLLLGGV